MTLRRHPERLVLLLLVAALLYLAFVACAAPAPAPTWPCAASEPRHLLNAAQSLPGAQGPVPVPPPRALGALGALLFALAAPLGPAAPPVVAAGLGLLGALLRGLRT